MIVEGVLKLNEMVDSICVVVRSDQSFATAIIVPDQDNLIRLSQDVLGKHGFSITQLCQNDPVKASLCKRLLNFGLMNGLEKFEIPKKVSIVLDEWTIESGLITASSKLKRKEVEKYYSDIINQMYVPEKQNSVRWIDENKNKS